MKDGKTTTIALALLRPRKGNREESGTGDLGGLALSIAEKGVLQPIIVRECEGQAKGEYEIVAGERRWRAAQLAGLEGIPARIVECDDQEASEISAIENLQREDMHPLDEAREVERLLALTSAGGEMAVDEVAAKIGKGATFVRQRMTLNSLCDEGKKLLRNGGENMTLAHALVLSRFPKHVQAQALKSMAQYYGSMSAKHLQSMVEREYMLDLGKAAFNKEDAKLVPKAGSCTLCSKRTGFTPALFPEVGKGDRCLDRNCFVAKLDANLACVEAALKKDNVEHLRVATDYGRQVAGGVLYSDQWAKAKKSDEGAMPALVVVGPERGTVIPWAVEGRSRSDGEGNRVPEKVSDEEKAARRKELLERKIKLEYRKELFARATSKANEGPVEPILRVLARAMFDRVEWANVQGLGRALGWKPEKHKGYGGFDWCGCAEKEIKKLDGTGPLFIFMAQCACAGALSQYAFMDTLEAVAKAVGVNAKKVEREVGLELRGKAKERAEVKKAIASRKGTRAKKVPKQALAKVKKARVKVK